MYMEISHSTLIATAVYRVNMKPENYIIYLFIYYTVYTHVKSFTIVNDVKA